MPSLKDLRNRISSVRNTQQTTKAMKMVSAAKLRRAQDAILNQRPYALSVHKMLSDLIQDYGKSLKSPFFEGGRQALESKEEAQKKVLLVVLSSDRGLCGSFNSSVVKAAQRFEHEQKIRGAQLSFAFFGKKAKELLPGRKIWFSRELGKKVEIKDCKIFVEKMISSYLAHEFDEVYFVYNEFKSAIQQIIRCDLFLPFQQNTQLETEAKPSYAFGPILRPNKEEIFELLLNKYFMVSFYRAVLESVASEHGSRMAAMENATRNAGEMIRKLSLQYNKQRQASITKELLEIISGSESQAAS